MIIIPFVYFGCLLFHQLKKNNWKLDIACFILIIYTISSFFSILVDLFDLRYIDERGYKISPSATLVYCGLITMCVWPFMKYSNLIIKEIKPIRMSSIIKALAWIHFVYFVINFVMSFNDIINVATTDDLSQIRNDHYSGNDDGSWLSHLPPLARLPFAFLNLTSGSTWVFIFLGFYCITIQKLPFRYFLLFFFSSINSLIGAFLIGGRSVISYWIIGLFACSLFFYRYIEKKHKKMIISLVTIILYVFVLFLIAMTISRFGERDAGEVSGTEGGMISYLGQSFINFCYFFDNFNCPLPSLQIIFPFTHRIVLGDAFLPVDELQYTISFLSGRDIGVFYTFLGHICVTSNPTVAVIYAFLLALVSLIIGRRLNGSYISLNTCYFYLLFSSVIFLGVFTHYYTVSNATFSAAFWGIVLILLGNKRYKYGK